MLGGDKMYNQLSNIFDEVKTWAVTKFCKAVSIFSPSGCENEMAKWIIDVCINDLGVSPEDIKTDSAHLQFGGLQGNLFITINGTDTVNITGFNAHMDTVQTLNEKPIVPIIQNDRISSDGNTILSADDKAGIASILAAVWAIKKLGLPHPTLQLIFTVSEETKIRGARYIDTSLIQAAQIIGFDLMEPNQILTGACASNKFSIDLQGIAAHAGVEPEKGASSLLAASNAISALQHDYLWGSVRNYKYLVSTNFNINGEYLIGTNSVQDFVRIIGEARSADQETLDEVTEDIREIFHREATLVRNISGQAVKAEVFVDAAYKAWNLPEDSRLIQKVAETMTSCDLQPNKLTVMGGVDASWFNAHGIPTTVVGVGMVDEHKKTEYLVLSQFYKAIELAFTLMLA